MKLFFTGCAVSIRCCAGACVFAELVNVQTVETPLMLAGLDSNNYDRLRFHTRHGRNATVSVDGRTASRPNGRGEFNDAIVITSRPLKDNELFEVSLDKMVDRWSGSIEAGACRFCRCIRDVVDRWSGAIEAGACRFRRWIRDVVDRWSCFIEAGFRSHFCHVC